MFVEIVSFAKTKDGNAHVYRSIKEINNRHNKSIMYIKIDKLVYHAASPFFRIGDTFKYGASTQSHKESCQTFSGKLTELISRRTKLCKPAQRILKVLIEKHINNEDMEKPISVDVYQMIEDSGYHNVASVYSAIGHLCAKNILAMSNEPGDKGTLTVFANPLIFGKNRVIIGDIVELAS